MPAQYFRDPEELDAYLEHSNFLADVNNERKVKNETYKENMKKLDHFVMYRFEEDQVLVPNMTAWFYETNSTAGVVTRLQDRPLYKEDWLGLKDLDGKGKLEFRKVKGQHMALTEELLEDTFQKYFSPETEEEQNSYEM